MLVCFEKKIEKFEEISKILLTILKVLENFNKIYTIMYAFHCLFFFKEKHCTLIVYITEFFLKSGGPNALLPPPPSKIWGAMAPWPPLWRTPCIAIVVEYSTQFRFRIKLGGGVIWKFYCNLKKTGGAWAPPPPVR